MGARSLMCRAQPGRALPNTPLGLSVKFKKMIKGKKKKGVCSESVSSSLWLPVVPRISVG